LKSGLVRPSIDQALALDTFGQGGIVNTKFGAVVVAEVKLSEIAVQAFLAAMLINPTHARL
jgi:hypothetical protein